MPPPQAVVHVATGLCLSLSQGQGYYELTKCTSHTPARQNGLNGHTGGLRNDLQTFVFGYAGVLFNPQVVSLALHCQHAWRGHCQHCAIHGCRASFALCQHCDMRGVRVHSHCVPYTLPTR